MYESILHNWRSLFTGLETAQQKNLNQLLSVQSEFQIRATIEILLGLGECGLCHLLDFKIHQLRLKSDLSHKHVWRDIIIKHVRQPSSIWFDVYQAGTLDRMEFMTLDSTPYCDLSERQQHNIVCESKRQTSIPPGHFMMGALPQDKHAKKVNNRAIM